MKVENIHQILHGKIINSIKIVSETPINAKKALKIRTFFCLLVYSHSTVAGGLLVIS